MESRIEMDEQYNDEMRDTRTLKQKVSSYVMLHRLVKLILYFVDTVAFK